MLEQAKSIFIIGIKGAAMANLAVILKKMGKNVTGADLEEEFITDKLLRNNNILYSIGFDPKNLPDLADLVVYSAAHAGSNNPIGIEAKKQGIKLISQVELIAKLMQQFMIKIAVSGCHGKTTTSALLSYSLIQLGEKPSYLIGAPSFNEFSGGDYEGDKYFVVEADEYGVNPPDDIRPKFHFLKPDYIICTNIDFDHPDVYKDLEETKKAFLEFFNTTPMNRFIGVPLVFCADNKNLMQIAQKLPRDRYVTYGFSKKADYVISTVKTDPSGTKFDLLQNDVVLGNFNISLFGDKNVSNTTSVIVMLLNLGFPVEKIQKALKNFTGAKRRFEKVFENKDHFLFDDYGHHPNEIQATIEAARKHFPNRRIVVIFQPHTYSRTQILLKDFAHALSLADYSYILPIFPSAREDKSQFHVTSEDIIKIGVKNCESVLTNNELVSKLQSNLKKGDVLFTMGAGDVYKLKDEVIKLL